MMIVVDNKAGEDPDYLVMADDGKGESIYIPTFLIGTYDGTKLKEAIHKDHEDHDEHDAARESFTADELAEELQHHGKNKVIVQAEISIASKTDDIGVDLWFAGAYELAQVGLQLEKYAEMQQIFKKHVTFQPRVLTTSCYFCDESTKSMCLNNGKYCPVIPIELRSQDTLRKEHISPKNVITQMIREMCVFEHLHDNYKSHWFQYMKILIETCINEETLDQVGMQPITEECNNLVIS